MKHILNKTIFAIAITLFSAHSFANICGAPEHDLYEAEDLVTKAIEDKSTNLSLSVSSALNKFSESNGSRYFTFSVRENAEVKAVLNGSTIEVKISARDNLYTTQVSVYLTKNCVTGIFDYVTEGDDFKVDVSGFYRRTNPTGRMCADTPWMC